MIWCDSVQATLIVRLTELMAFSQKKKPNGKNTKSPCDTWLTNIDGRCPPATASGVMSLNWSITSLSSVVSVNSATYQLRWNVSHNMPTNVRKLWNIKSHPIRHTHTHELNCVHLEFWNWIKKHKRPPRHLRRSSHGKEPATRVLPPNWTHEVLLNARVRSTLCKPSTPHSEKISDQFGRKLPIGTLLPEGSFGCIWQDKSRETQNNKLQWIPNQRFCLQHHHPTATTHWLNHTGRESHTTINQPMFCKMMQGYARVWISGFCDFSITSLMILAIVSFSKKPDSFCLAEVRISGIKPPLRTCGKCANTKLEKGRRGRKAEKGGQSHCSLVK